jgi:hypothetical protein
MAPSTYNLGSRVQQSIANKAGSRPDLKNRICSKPRSRTVTNSGACSLPIFGMGSFSKDVGDLLGCKVSVSHWSIDR